MGHTNSWSQKRDLTADEWRAITADVQAIVNDVQHVQGIPLANAMGEAGTQPEFGANRITFNGVGKDGCEDFAILRKRGKRWDGKPYTGDFCKTYERPYDVAVTATLAYLEAAYPDAFSAGGDANGFEWMPGVELARRVLPRYANQIDIPLSARKWDRWDWRRFSPRVDAPGYDVRHCIDGHVYAFEVDNEARCYRFDDVAEAEHFFKSFIEPRRKVMTSWAGPQMEGGKPVFWNSGSYDKARHARIKRQQTAILKELIDGAVTLGRNIPPPAFARPNVMPKVPREQASLADLFDLCA